MGCVLCEETELTDRGKIIGVTGGIACGKSTVCQLLAQKGAFVIDLDRVGHQLLQNTSSVFGQLLSTFGTTILDGSGTISRSKLGEIVFSDSEARKQLDSIMHPVIVEKSRHSAHQFVEGDSSRIAVIDSPLLIEVNGHETVDLVIVVITDAHTQKQRLIKRSHDQKRPIDCHQIETRIKAQLPLSEKVKYADFVIDNSGAVDKLGLKVDELWEILTS